MGHKLSALKMKCHSEERRDEEPAFPKSARKQQVPHRRFAPVRNDNYLGRNVAKTFEMQYANLFTLGSVFLSNG
jgi:hypothetical protein